MALNLILAQLMILLLLTSSGGISTPIAESNNCSGRCGNIDIPFPFGTKPNCYYHYSFFISCNHTYSPPKAFLWNTTIEVKNILLTGQIQVMQRIAHDCYNQDGTKNFSSDPSIYLPAYLTINNTANKFTVVGCDTVAYSRQRKPFYMTGCGAFCDTKDDITERSCTGVGCCQTSFPKYVSVSEVWLTSHSNYTDVWSFNRCGHAFVVEESKFNFSAANFTSLMDVEELPMIVDWAIGNVTSCEEAQTNLTSYACKSINSTCYKPDNGHGYRCSCSKGYQGNPYLVNGCKDVNECSDSKLHDCLSEKHCINMPGHYYCRCPKGYQGDGKQNGRGCGRGQSPVFKLVAGISSGITVLLVALFLLCLEYKKRKLIRMKGKYFLLNGGHLLVEKLGTRGNSTNSSQIFTSEELKKATKNFDKSRIIGQGGYGTVYKGILPDNRVVAIKKPKFINTNQIEQFVNEVIVVSRINHRNVVRLLGCCLETKVPLLVYEFINNGTLSEHIHDKTKARALSWEMRLKIACETAGVLSYLHSEASIPIIHRDVKSANILLDDHLTAKVSDFGASRLVPLDKTQLSTIIQGTFGYLDPEYFLTSQLTEKSDVYSYGVVLLELLTGMKALLFDRPEEQRNLAYYFLSMFKQDRLFQLLDDNVIEEGNEQQLIQVAELAKRCLHVKGDKRPGMKEVAMQLEGLILARCNPRPKNEDNLEELPYETELLEHGTIGGSSSSGYDSIRQEMLSMSGGR